MARHIGTAGVEMSFLAKLKEQAMIRTISISIVAVGLVVRLRNAPHGYKRRARSVR
jgi:hypothetical protein